MNKYIVSLVFGKTMGKGGDISIQNEVYVLQAEDAQEAYERCKGIGTIKYPDHRIVVKVVVEMNEALAKNIN